MRSPNPLARFKRAYRGKRKRKTRRRIREGKKEEHTHNKMPALLKKIIRYNGFK